MFFRILKCANRYYGWEFQRQWQSIRAYNALDRGLLKEKGGKNVEEIYERKNYHLLTRRWQVVPATGQPPNLLPTTFKPIGQRNWNDILAVNCVITWTLPGEFRRLWQKCLDTKVFIEIMTDSRDSHAAPRFRKWWWKFLEFTMAGSRPSRKWQEEMSVIAWIRTVITSNLTCHPWSFIRSRGWSRFAAIWTERVPLPRWSSLKTHSILQAGLIDGVRDPREGRQTVFFTALNPRSNESNEGVSSFIRTTKGTLQKQVESDPGRNLLDQCERSSG